MKINDFAKDLEKILKSKEYKDALSKIKTLKDRLKKSSAKEALKVRDEKTAFFSKLKTDNTQLYMIFRIDEKIINEMLIKKIMNLDIKIN